MFESHRKSRHRYRRKFRHRPGDGKTVRRARRKRRRGRAPQEELDIAGRRDRRNRRLAHRHWPATSPTKPMQSAGRTRRQTNSAASTSRSTMPASTGEMGGPISRTLHRWLARHARNQPDWRLSRRKISDSRHARTRRRLADLHLDLRRPHRRHARNGGLCGEQGGPDRPDPGAGCRVRPERHPCQRLAARRHRHAGGNLQDAGVAQLSSKGFTR